MFNILPPLPEGDKQLTVHQNKFQQLNIHQLH
jgi:hypothetical protein